MFINVKAVMFILIYLIRVSLSDRLLGNYPTNCSNVFATNNKVDYGREAIKQSTFRPHY